VPEMLYTDQKWLDWAPALFETVVWRDEGVNVAYWNVHERDVHQVNGEYLAGTAPLRLFHFSGFPQATPSLLSVRPGERFRFDPAGNPAVVELCERYGAELERRGLQHSRSTPYAFAATPSGVLLTLQIRRAFRDATLLAERSGNPLPPAPFLDAPGFDRWLADVGLDRQPPPPPRWPILASSVRAVRRALRPVRRAWRRIGRVRAQRA
jgi:hypothetical protein